MPLRSAVSPGALRVMQEALKGLEQAVAPVDAKDFKITTLEDVKKVALEVEDCLAARQSLRNMRRLMPLFKGLEHYSKTIEILCNGTPFLPWIWAPIKLILRISSDHVAAFDKLINQYARIADCLTRFEILKNTFNQNEEFQNILAVFYSDILQFHKQAYKFTHRKSWILLFSSSWGRFERHFDDVISNLKSHEDLLDRTANAIGLAEAHQMRVNTERLRTEQFEKLAEKQVTKTAQEYREIEAWLKIDMSEQATVFDIIANDAVKHPHTCDWILKVDQIKLWMRCQGTEPFIWLHGNPGTGKSVLATQVIKFLSSPGQSRVLSHFCTSSYASSTRYDYILRSLLLQLIQENTDLVAYVHMLKDTEFARSQLKSARLERLIQDLAGAVSISVADTQYIHIVIDGLDECEADKQSRLTSLLERLASPALSSTSVVYKVLLLSRTTETLKKALKRKLVRQLSMTTQKTHVENAIGLYAKQKLGKLRPRFSQMGIGMADIDNMAVTIAQKADGMFLWARLVLEYVCSNLFYNKTEVLSAIHTLPRELSDFYQKMLAQMSVNLDGRSIYRVKSIFGWIAFAKRPLRAFEFQSALTLSSGDVDVSEVVPTYIFDMCAPLVEERIDTTFGFIHSSVKEYLLDPQSGPMISKLDAQSEHAVASVSCLLAGLNTFNAAVPTHQQTSRVLDGLHAMHIYSNEHWVDHLLEVGISAHGFHPASRIFALTSSLSAKLDEMEAVTQDKTSDIMASEVFLQKDLSCIQNLRGVFKAASISLKAKASKTIDNDLSDQDHSQDHQPATGLGGILARYQSAIVSILTLETFPGVGMEALERFKKQYATSAFTCRLGACARSTVGFEDANLRAEHERSHVQLFRCEVSGCQYPPCPSSRALKRHLQQHHNDSTQRKPSTSIRRVPKDSSIKYSKTKSLYVSHLDLNSIKELPTYVKEIEMKYDRAKQESWSRLLNRYGGDIGQIPAEDSQKFERWSDGLIEKQNREILARKNVTENSSQNAEPPNLVSRQDGNGGFDLPSTTNIDAAQTEGLSVESLNSQLPPLDFSGIEYSSYMPNDFDTSSTAPEMNQGLFSAGLSASEVDWSYYPMDVRTTIRTVDNQINQQQTIPLEHQQQSQQMVQPTPHMEQQMDPRLTQRPVSLSADTIDAMNDKIARLKPEQREKFAGLTSEKLLELMAKWRLSRGKTMPANAASPPFPLHETLSPLASDSMERPLERNQQPIKWLSAQGSPERMPMTPQQDAQHEVSSAMQQWNARYA